MQSIDTEGAIRVNVHSARTQLLFSAFFIVSPTFLWQDFAFLWSAIGTSPPKIKMFSFQRTCITHFFCTLIVQAEALSKMYNFLQNHLLFSSLAVSTLSAGGLIDNKLKWWKWIECVLSCRIHPLRLSAVWRKFGRGIQRSCWLLTDTLFRMQNQKKMAVLWCCWHQWMGKCQLKNLCDGRGCRSENT